MIFYFKIIFDECENLLKLMFIEHNDLYEITQIVMIRQNNNRIIIIFKIMFLLLKHCNNEQKFLIMRFIINFNKNHFFRIKRNEMSLRLFNVIRERHELK